MLLCYLTVSWIIYSQWISEIVIEPEYSWSEHVAFSSPQKMSEMRFILRRRNREWYNWQALLKLSHLSKTRLLQISERQVFFCTGIIPTWRNVNAAFSDFLDFLYLCLFLWKILTENPRSCFFFKPDLFWYFFGDRNSRVQRNYDDKENQIILGLDHSYCMWNWFSWEKEWSVLMM